MARIGKHSEPDLTGPLLSAAPNGDGFLVVYSHGQGSPFKLAEAYLAAADAVISAMPRYLEPAHDELAVPLLNIHVNAIEFSTKLLIEQLVKHRAAKRCKSISAPPADYQQALYKSHDLAKLLDVVSEMLRSPTNSLHPLADWSTIQTFLRRFPEQGITSESTRYVSESSGRVYPLYSEQRWIEPRTVHRAVKDACRSLLTFAQSSVFHFCEAGEFRKKRLNELNAGRKALGALHDAASSSPARARNPDIFYMESLSDSELACLVLGLYFTRRPIVIEDLSYFQEWTREKLLDKAFERAHLVDGAIRGIESHIQFVKSKMTLERTT